MLAQGISSQCLTYIPFQRNEVHKKLFNEAFQFLKERRMASSMTITNSEKPPYLPF